MAKKEYVIVNDGKIKAQNELSELIEVQKEIRDTLRELVTELNRLR